MVGCCSLGCTNRTEKGFKLYRFPADPTRRQIWMAQVNRPNWKPLSAAFLCEVHFAYNQFENRRLDGKRKLRWNAIPTLFPERNDPPTGRKKPSARKSKGNLTPIISQMVGSRDSILWDRTPDELGFAPETPDDSSDLTADGGEHYGAHENGPIKEEMVEWVDEDLLVSEDNDKSREDTQSPVFPGVHVILNEAPGPARKKRKPQHYDDVQTSTRGDTDYAAAAAAAAAVAFNSDPLTLVSKGLLLQHERNAKSPRHASSPTEQHQQHQVAVSEEEEELFGRYVAATIKKFSSKSKSVAKMRIQHVLFEVEEAERLGKDCSLKISVNNGN